MTDRETGAQLYRLSLLLIQEDENAMLILVTVPGRPEIPVSAPVKVSKLRTSSWEMDGRSGMSWRCDSVEAIGGPSVDEHGAPTVPLAARQPQKLAS